MAAGDGEEERRAEVSFFFFFLRDGGPGSAEAAEERSVGEGAEGRRGRSTVEIKMNISAACLVSQCSMRDGSSIRCDFASEKDGCFSCEKQSMFIVYARW